MRVLVVATHPEWTPGTRLMASLAAGLAARGDVVALATAGRSSTAMAVARTWPRLSVRSVSGRRRFRQAMSLRSIVAALRPDILLVGSAHDAGLAELAAGADAGIVRRVTAAERAAATAAASPRLAGARRPVTLWGAERLVIGWPFEVSSPVHDTGDGVVRRLPSSAPQLVLVPGRRHDVATATALRAMAHLRTRHPALRVLLLGEAAALQATRLHAAALGLTACLEVVPVDALLHHELSHASAAWIAAADDDGAVCALAAMQQRLPVIVAQDAAFRDLIEPGITGVVASEHRALVVAELTRLLSDPVVRRRMGDAAARAAAAFGWDAFVDEAAMLLAQAGGLGAMRATRRPSRTSA